MLGNFCECNFQEGHRCTKRFTNYQVLQRYETDLALRWRGVRVRVQYFRLTRAALIPCQVHCTCTGTGRNNVARLQ